ncbi:hypothetical protein VT84_37430 [Gemmata sp. SH-PL17]|nr:hypothetical protein VT84_37430 [Gemmata sp. SH-PL17]
MAKKSMRYTATDGKMVLVLEVAEEGGFTVTAPFIPGLDTEAETLEEAFAMAKDCAAALKSARAQMARRRKRISRSDTR